MTASFLVGSARGVMARTLQVKIKRESTPQMMSLSAPRRACFGRPGTPCVLDGVVHQGQAASCELHQLQAIQYSLQK